MDPLRRARAARRARVAPRGAIRSRPDGRRIEVGRVLVCHPAAARSGYRRGAAHTDHGRVQGIRQDLHYDRRRAGYRDPDAADLSLPRRVPGLQHGFLRGDRRGNAHHRHDSQLILRETNPRGWSVRRHRMVDQMSPELPQAERKSRAPHPQRSRWTIGRVLAQAAVVILIIVALFPFLFMLRVALSSARDYLAGIGVLSAPITFENFASVYGGTELGLYLLNSLLYSVLTTLIVLIIGSMRSEEHTSELQSRQYLVCRLLLEKKKNSPLYLTFLHLASFHHTRQ